MKYCSTKLLNEKENNDIESLLHGDEESMCTCIVELYATSDSDDHKTWHKLYIGVLCFIKNDEGYFLKLYCPIMKIILWQYEYSNFADFSQTKQYFIQFHGKDEIYGINFSCLIELSCFKVAMRKADSEKKSFFGGIKSLFRSYLRPNKIEIGSPTKSTQLTKITNAENSFNIDPNLEHVLNSVGITVEDLKKSPEITKTVYKAMVSTGDIRLSIVSEEKEEEEINDNINSVDQAPHQDLLNQIVNAKLTDLKHIELEEKPFTHVGDDLKDALLKVINKRKEAMHSDDEEEEEDNNYDKNEWNP